MFINRKKTTDGAAAPQIQQPADAALSEEAAAPSPAPDAAPSADEEPAASASPAGGHPNGARKVRTVRPLVNVTPASRLVSPRIFGAVTVLCLAVIAVAAGWTIPFAEGPVVMGDELGYWGNAAMLAGHDWSGVMGAIPYYGYGYSFFLVPLFWLGLPMTVMYKAALVLNILFLFAAFGLTYRCLRRLFSALPPVGAMLVSMAATLYTNNLVQAQGAWSETLLYLVYWLVFALVLRLLEQPSIPTAVGLALAAGYLYMVHLRTIGVLIALVMTVLLFWAARRLDWKQVLAFFLSFVGILLIQNLIKMWFNGNVYVSTLYAGTNDYAGQINNMFGAMSTLEGWRSLFYSACGKMFYLASSTLMLGLVTLRLLFGDFFSALWQWFRSGLRQLNPRKLPSIFLLLSFGGTYLVNVIAMRGTSRLDILVYGRYMEFAFGPLIAIGLALLLLGRVGLGQAVGCCGVATVLAAFTNAELIRGAANDAENYNFLCVTTWRHFDNLHHEIPQFTYFVLVVTGAIFLIAWAAQYAFSHSIFLDDASPRRVAVVKTTRPMLRILLPVMVCAGFWIWAICCQSSFSATQASVSTAMDQVWELCDQAGRQPNKIVWVQKDEATEQGSFSAAYLQVRIPDARVDRITASTFRAAELDPEALYVISADSPAEEAVSERCIALITNDFFTLYAAPGSVWAQAALKMNLLTGWADGVPVYYDDAAVLTKEAKLAGRDDQTGAEEGLYYKESIPSYTRTEADTGLTTLPVEITSNGAAGPVTYTGPINLPAGQYEITFTVTANGGGDTRGEFYILDESGRRLRDITLDRATFADGVRTRMRLTLTSMLDQDLSGIQFQLKAEAGAVLTLHEITYSRVGEVGEVITDGTTEMDQLGRLLELDYEYRPVYVVPKESQRERASVAELQRAFPDRTISLVSDISLLRDQPGILLVPTDRQETIYMLLGSYVIAERLGDYTVLLPTDSGTANEFVGHGGTLMSDGYSVDLRYYVDGAAQSAGTVSAVPPAGRYYIMVEAKFDNVLTGSYGTLEVSVDGVSLGRSPMEMGEERTDTAYSPYELVLDGTQELTVDVEASVNARLSNLKVALRWLGDVPATYGDAQ